MTDKMQGGSGTFHGLMSWHKHVFEKLGWVMLAVHRKKYANKIQTYREMLAHLIEAISNYQQISNLSSSEINDLAVMHEDVMILQQILDGCTRSDGVINGVMAGGKRRTTKKMAATTKPMKKSKKSKKSKRSKENEW
jgi:hypothetical protein